MRTTTTLALVLALAAITLVPTSTANCSTIGRSTTVPTEGATATAQITQCQDGFNDGQYFYSGTFNSTSVYVSDPTTQTGASANDYSYSNTQGASNGDWSATDRQHAYGVGASGQGTWLNAAAGEGKDRYTSPNYQSCNGNLRVEVYRGTPLENGNLAEYVPFGGSSPVSCIDDDTENLLP